MQKKKLKSAFTLIELLVVIAIVGILTGFIFVSMNSAITASKDAKRKADISAIAKAISMYSAQNGGALPSTGTSCDICNGCAGACANLYTNIAPYLTSLPTDPNGATVYYKYTYSATLPSFTVQSTLSTGYAYQFDSATDRFSTNNFISPCVSGGGLACTETINGGYVVDKYTLSGSTTGTTTWQIPTGVSSVEVLIVAGGGSGGMGQDSNHWGSGGGAGGILSGVLNLVNGNYVVTVGAGGNRETTQNSDGYDGSNSLFSTYTAYGGGGGRGSYNGGGRSGGSSGGSNTVGSTAKTQTSQSPLTGYGNNGGGSGGTNVGCGGGGAGAVGYNGILVTAAGISNSITGIATTYGIGGASASHDDGGPGTGNGGGGGMAYGGAGGSGVVIIRYLHP